MGIFSSVSLSLWLCARSWMGTDVMLMLLYPVTTPGLLLIQPNRKRTRALM